MIQRRHPARNIQRLIQTQSIFLRYGFDILVNQEELKTLQNLISDQPRVPDELTQAQKIRMMLEELGPTYVKLGQIAGSQYSAMPKEISKELENLQNHVAPFASDEAVAIIEREMNETIDTLFASFDRQPIAAASIAQVHRAQLHDGTAVVVKVQRPNIEDQIEADLEIMQATAQILENTLGRNRGLMEIVEEFRVSLRGELDFRNEGRNADRLRNNLESVFKVTVPRIHWGIVTDKVLTMDYVEGAKVTNIAEIKRAGLDADELADRFTEAMSQQILIDGFFHGDPHPGNIIVNLNDSTVTLLDLGMVGYLDEENRRELGNMMIALQRGNTHELVRIAMRLGVIFKTVDVRGLRRHLEHILNRYMVASLSQVSFADMMYEMMTVFYDYGVRLPPELTSAIKALIQTQEIASKLNPELQIADIASTVSDQLFWEQFKPDVIQDRLNETTAEVLRLAPIAADAIERILREAKSGKLTIQIDTSDLQMQLESLSENNKRITVGLAVGGMTIGSAIAMSVNPAEAWSFIPILGVVGFTVSVAVGGLLILKLLWEIWGP